MGLIANDDHLADLMKSDEQKNPYKYRQCTAPRQLSICLSYTLGGHHQCFPEAAPPRSSHARRHYPLNTTRSRGSCIFPFRITMIMVIQRLDVFIDPFFSCRPSIGWHFVFNIVAKVARPREGRLKVMQGKHVKTHFSVESFWVLGYST